ncbi:MAG: hypothetical protein LBC63_09795 [Holophagales bacterium]|jgi:hypothetical protein|nr:hypothetical protein [Holophagales bacterium]
MKKQPPNENHLHDATAQTYTPQSAGSTVQDEYAHLFEPIPVTKNVKIGTTTETITEHVPFPKALQKMKLDFVQQPPDSRRTHCMLSNAEYGLFIALRDLAAENVLITSDTKTPAKLTYTLLDEFEQLWPQIAGLFVIEGGSMFCPEVIPWLREMRAKSQKCSNAGSSKGGRGNANNECSTGD